MAVIVKDSKKSLRIGFGSSANDGKKMRNKSFSNIHKDATNDGMYKIGTELLKVYDEDVLKVSKVVAETLEVE